ncbi:putative RecB family nuclease [Marmoricola sp. OAE513]|uniref:ribonuclease H-like domain-containing protein n=1 Tax=Marmoricola sp. OAE513 TaxID=2817894 RepID=UPI001AE4C6F3
MTTTSATRSATLSAYAAKTCGFQVYLDNAPFSRDLPRDARDLMTAGRAEQGRTFEAAVFEKLQSVHGSDCVVVTLTEDELRLSYTAQRAVRRERTLQAMDDGTAIICGGALDDVLPQSFALDGVDTLDLLRTGDPDVLVRQTDGPAATYLPVDVKNHKTLKDRKRGPFARTSPVSSLHTGTAGAGEATDLGWDPSYRVKDGLQLAHYTRVLETLGRHPGPDQRLGGVIGADAPLDDLTVSWLDLDETVRGDSVLGRYDREFSARVDAVRAAVGQTRYESGSVEGVRSGRFGKAECSGCSRQTVCRADAGPDDVSFLFTVGRPNGAAWDYLYGHGAATPHGLASLDVLRHNDDYEAAARSGGGKAVALREVVERARMHRDDELLRRHPGTPAVPVPTFDLEIDFDIEWDSAGIVYQWGASVRTGQDNTTESYDAESRYRFETMTRPEAEALAVEFFDNLDRVVEQAESDGLTVGLFHWTSPEQWQTAKFLGERLTERYGEARVLDLKQWVESSYFSRDGYSLKKVAPACRFDWNLPGAGGDMSMVMIDQFRFPATPADKAAAEEWLLRYNSADCRAQAKIRDYLRDLPEVVTAP